MAGTKESTTGTTIMRCSRPFAEGKIRVHVNGHDYQFAPNRLGHSICAVLDEDVFTLMNISSAYRKYASAEIPRVDLTPPDPEGGVDADSEGLEGGDVTEERTPAFLDPSPPPTNTKPRNRGRRR